jgi:hypothetical protein
VVASYQAGMSFLCRLCKKQYNKYFNFSRLHLRRISIRKLLQKQNSPLQKLRSMKQLKILILLMPIALYSAGQGIPKKSKPVTKKDTASGYNANPIIPPKNTNQVASPSWAGSQAMLEYIGTVNNGFSLGIQVAIDTAIGVRYEFTMENGAAVLDHVAIFYKFSDPYQSILYNFVTHKSHVIKYGGVSDSNPNVEVVGTENVDSFRCTHLQHGGGSDEISDYWMSPALPGFSKLVNALKTINANLSTLAFSGTIFNWGGLVKWTITSKTVNMELHLIEANTDVELSASTFNVPSK